MVGLKEDDSRFPSKLFRLTVPKPLVEKPVCAAFQKFSVSEKVYGKRGEYQGFPSNFFISQCPNFS